MPINNGVGYSEYTPKKQELFRKMIRMNICAWKSIMQKQHRHQTYTYFDINAGPGVTNEYGYGSPFIFLDEAIGAGLQYCAHFIEIDSQNAFDLRLNLANNFQEDAYYNVWNGDNGQIINNNWIDNQKNRNTVPGLLYCDPSGSPPPFDVLIKFSLIWRSIDILINLSAANIKRDRKRNNREFDLIYNLNLFDKKNILIREPYGCHQWSFIYLTNGPSFEWKKQKFHLISSEIGTKTLEKMNYTEEELKQREQLQLFELSGISKTPRIFEGQAKGC